MKQGNKPGIGGTVLSVMPMCYSALLTSKYS